MELFNKEKLKSELKRAFEDGYELWYVSNPRESSIEINKKGKVKKVLATVPHNNKKILHDFASIEWQKLQREEHQKNFSASVSVDKNTVFNNLLKSLENIDWYYQQSDDPFVYRKGKDKIDRLEKNIKIAADLDLEKTKIIIKDKVPESFYTFIISMINKSKKELAENNISLKFKNLVKEIFNEEMVDSKSVPSIDQDLKFIKSLLEFEKLRAGMSSGTIIGSHWIKFIYEIESIYSHIIDFPELYKTKKGKLDNTEIIKKLNIIINLLGSIKSEIIEINNIEKRD